MGIVHKAYVDGPFAFIATSTNSIELLPDIIKTIVREKTKTNINYYYQPSWICCQRRVPPAGPRCGHETI